MDFEKIDPISLLRLAEAGAVRAALVVGLKGGWGIVVKYGATQRSLTTTRTKQVRVFKRLDAVADYLQGLGISRFEVDAEEYAPAEVKHTRPDRSVAMKKAHEAAATLSRLEKEGSASTAFPRPHAARHCH